MGLTSYVNIYLDFSGANKSDSMFTAATKKDCLVDKGEFTTKFMKKVCRTFYDVGDLPIIQVLGSE